MLKGVDMTTTGTRPCPSLRVGVSVVNHLNNQVAMQTHRWLTVDIQIGHGLWHELDPPILFVPRLCNSAAGTQHNIINDNGAFLLDAEVTDQVEIPWRGEK
jgi:hypothetical protein